MLVGGALPLVWSSHSPSVPVLQPTVPPRPKIVCKVNSDAAHQTYQFHHRQKPAGRRFRFGHAEPDQSLDMRPDHDVYLMDATLMAGWLASVPFLRARLKRLQPAHLFDIQVLCLIFNLKFESKPTICQYLGQFSSNLNMSCRHQTCLKSKWRMAAMTVELKYHSKMNIDLAAPGLFKPREICHGISSITISKKAIWAAVLQKLGILRGRFAV